MEPEQATMRPLALITGASTSLGLELSRQFAMNGFDLLITDRESNLEESRDICMDLGADVYTFHADLSGAAGVEKLYAEIKKMNRPLEAAVINTGSGAGGPFWETELKNELELIRLNVMSVVHLTKRILPDMMVEDSGRILFASPLSGETSVPFESVCAGSKAFLFSFAESLRNELKGSGVSVTSLIPVPENTNDSTEEIARQGFIALMKGKDHVMPGKIKTKVSGAAYKIIPKWAKAYVSKEKAS